MEQEIIERLTRVETKLDIVIPHIEKVNVIERDLRVAKKAFSIMWGGLVGIGTIVATYLGSKK